MCMITYLPPFVKVPVKGIMNGGTYNDDGHGWAIAAETGVMLTARYMDLEPAIDTFVATREAYPHAPALFHSRWATHGETTVKNVHPFYVGGKETVVAHNGVLPTTFHPAKGDRRSDTRIMADEWLFSQTRGLWTKSERRRIGSLIGTGNKLAILSVSDVFDKPRGFLVNAAQGVQAHGAWFSNHDFEGWGRAISARGGWGWDSGSWTSDTKTVGNWTTGKRNGSEFDCDFCFALGTVDPGSQICRYCLTCQDCYETLDDCLCFVPKGPGKGSESDDDESGDQLSPEERMSAAIALLSDDDFERRVRPYYHD